MFNHHIVCNTDCASLFFCAVFLFLFTGRVFSQDTLSEKKTVERIIITGNKTTRAFIIYRELIFHEYDTLPAAVLENAMERSRENLLNTSLFNFVTIKSQEVEPGKVYIVVDVAERWYIFPVPIFEIVERNFNEWWQNKNFKRTNYGFFLNWENFRGRKENVRLLFRWGYSQRLGFSYIIPYINRRQNDGLAFNIAYSRRHEIAYALNQNKLQYYKDPENIIRREFFSAVKWSHRSGFYKTNSLIAEFHQNKVADTIPYLNPDYYLPGLAEQKFFSLRYVYKDDHRDIQNYPLKGYFFNFEVVKDGFGMFTSDPDLLWTSFYYKKFFEHSKKWHSAFSAKYKLSGQSPVPFFNQEAMGYEGDVLRGYEYYVINGENFLLLKSDIKFTLLEPRVIKVKYIPVEKFRTIPYAFYLNAFADAGYVWDRRFAENNPLSNSWQYSFGAGIDYVTYYDIVFRVDFAINKFAEKGIFIHLTAPI